MAEDNNTNKHTAEMGDVMKGKVRIAVPISLLLLLFLLGTGVLLFSLLMTAQRSVAYATPSKYEGVTLSPAVNKVGGMRHNRRPTVAGTSTDSKFSPCQTMGIGGQR